MDAEEQHVRQLQAKDKVFIHEPICGGLRTCGNCSQVADWNEEGFVCSNRTYGEGDPVIPKPTAVPKFLDKAQ